MKNPTVKSIQLAVLFFMVFCTASAQEKKDNIIKINVPALIFKNFSFQYERAVGKKQSLALAVRYRPESSIPFKGAVEKWVDDNSIRVDLGKIGNFGITPEYRFYFGKEATQGFYIGPFVSYNHYSGKVPINYNDYVNNASVEKTAVFTGSVNTFTGGFQLGAQWKLSSKFSLDWWIVGPNYGISKGNFDFAGQLNDIEEISMDYELNKIKETAPIIKLKDIDVRQDGSGASFKIDGPWLGLRAMGINIGYRF